MYSFCVSGNAVKLCTIMTGGRGGAHGRERVVFVLDALPPAIPEGARRGAWMAFSYIKGGRCGQLTLPAHTEAVG